MNITNIICMPEKVKIYTGISLQLNIKTIPVSNIFNDLIYESNDTNICEVNPYGKITGKNEGNCEIYIYSKKDNSIKDICKIRCDKGLSTKDNFFIINNKKDYITFVGMVKINPYIDVELNSNINFENDVNIPIIDTYNGTFNGKNHYMYNLCNTNSLFNTLEYNSKINDLYIYGYLKCNNKKYVGVLANINNGNINNCHNYANIITDKCEFTGGIVGYNNIDGTIINTVNNSNIVSKNSDNYSYSGGIVGKNKGVIIYSINNSYLDTNNTSGGIVGLNVGYINSCKNSNTINSTKYKGAIVGLNNGKLIKNTYLLNTGFISDTEDSVSYLSGFEN